MKTITRTVTVILVLAVFAPVLATDWVYVGENKEWAEYLERDSVIYLDNGNAKVWVRAVLTPYGKAWAEEFSRRGGQTGYNAPDYRLYLRIYTRDRRYWDVQSTDYNANGDVLRVLKSNPVFPIEIAPDSYQINTWNILFKAK